MTNAERVVSLLLEDTPSIRGEYWIINGDVAFADGDVGDVNHEGYAIDHARREILDHFNMDSDDEFIGDQELAERVVEALHEQGVQCDTVNWFAAAYAHLKQSGADERTLETLKCAGNRGADAREIAMRYWGWKWCRKNNVSTWNFTTVDRHSIVGGVNEIISQEMHDDGENWDEMVLSIGVSSNHSHFEMTLAELESGAAVHRDPTWRLPGATESVEDSGMMDYMKPEIDRLTSKRKLNVGEEASNGTFDIIHLCRRGLEKLEEIDYTGYKHFVAINKEPIEGLNMLLASHAGEAEFESNEDAVAAYEAVETLWEVLVELFSDHYCMFGTHFGSSVGSGSSVGCWPSSDYLRDAVEEGTEVIEVEMVGNKFPEKIRPGHVHRWMTSPSGYQAMYDPAGTLLWKY